ncbi:hypothetical protein GCM10010528_00670 [Gordonia defluvii]|uniref:AAA+ ATPase domain-containing protein n=1 Tax=Gordonia defluvii TaxID=283718 RepID=A0ABN3Y832_9ACTN
MTDENETRPSGGTGAGSTELQECNPNDTRAVSRSEFLGLLGHGSGVFTALAELAPTPGAPFVARVVDSTEAAGLPANLSVNEFIGICPVAGPARRGRGSADDVTALPAIWADLDVKPGACASLDVAEQIITALSVALGTEPTMTTRSGSGLHPYWPIDDEAAQGLDDEKRERVALLLRRWGTAVAKVATAHCASVDNVYDLARVMRAPGSLNLKNGTVAPVVCERGHGAPIALDQLVEACEVLDVPEVVADPVAEPVQASGWADKACRYSVGMVAGWATDVPNAGRHPWLMGQATRLEAARINGCLTADGYREARAVLAQRFGELCERGIAGDRRPVGVGEVSEAFSWASIRAAAKSADQIAAELGRHFHDEDLLPEVAPAPPTPPGDAVERTTVLDGELIDDNGPWSAFLPGGAFILDEPEGVPALWGEGERVLWSEGEAMMLAGPQGLGKTTIAGLLTRALIADDDAAGERPQVLGLPVRQARQRVLFLAMDRPRQAARALRRQLGGFSRELLDEKLIVWKGPPIADLAENPGLLTKYAEHAEADVVIVDSLKDAVLGLSDDAVGAGWNRASQGLIQSDRDLLVLHHTRKTATGDPTVDDIYGSTWLTSGTGSVVLLGGRPGDPIVRMWHVKAPGEQMGPWTLLHNQDTGEMQVRGGSDSMLAELAARGGSITVRDAAQLMFETDNPRKADTEKARRRLDKMVEQGLLTVASAPGKPARYAAAVGVTQWSRGLSHEEPSREVTQGHEVTNDAGQKVTQGSRTNEAARGHVFGGLLRDPERDVPGQEKGNKTPTCEGCGSRVSSPTIQLCNNCARAEQ